MIGRQAYQHPWLLTELETLQDRPARTPGTRTEVVEAMLPYIDREQSNGVPLKHITRHMLGLFAGQPGARRWRRYLSEHGHRADADVNTLLSALAKMRLAA